MALKKLSESEGTKQQPVPIGLALFIRRHGRNQGGKNGYHKPEGERVEKNCDKNEGNAGPALNLHVLEAGHAQRKELRRQHKLADKFLAEKFVSDTGRAHVYRGLRSSRLSPRWCQIRPQAKSSRAIHAKKATRAASEL